MARETGRPRSFETSTFSIPPAILAARTSQEDKEFRKNRGSRLNMDVDASPGIILLYFFLEQPRFFASFYAFPNTEYRFDVCNDVRVRCNLRWTRKYRFVSGSFPSILCPRLLFNAGNGITTVGRAGNREKEFVGRKILASESGDWTTGNYVQNGLKLGDALSKLRSFTTSSWRRVIAYSPSLNHC